MRSRSSRGRQISTSPNRVSTVAVRLARSGRRPGRPALAKARVDFAAPRHGKCRGGCEQRGAACLRVGQTAVHHSPCQQVEVVLRHTSLPRVLGRPFGVNISLAIVHHRLPLRRRGSPSPPVPVPPWPAPPSLANAAIRARITDDPDDGWLSVRVGSTHRRQPDLSLRRRGPRQALVVASTAIPRLRRGRHRMDGNAVGIALLDRTKPCPCEGGGRGGAARWRGTCSRWCPPDQGRGQA